MKKSRFTEQQIVYAIKQVEAGVPIVYDATIVLAAWSLGAEFEDERLVFAIRPAPEGGTISYWEFGSVNSPDALQPEIRIVFTPPVDFQLP